MEEDIILPLENYFVDKNSPQILLKCLPNRCTGYDYNSCGEAFYGFLCANCQEDYFEYGDKCLFCTTAYKIIGRLVIGFFILFCTIYFIKDSLSFSISEERDKYEVDEMKEIIISGLQLFVVLGNFNIEIPYLIDWLLKLFDFLNIDLRATGADCIISQ